MILVEQRVSDTFSYDGTSLEVVGVFSSFETLPKLFFSEHSGEIVNHVPPRNYEVGRFEVRYNGGRTLSSFPTDKYEYREIELDKKLN